MADMRDMGRFRHFSCAHHPEISGQVPDIACRVNAMRLIMKAGFSRSTTPAIAITPAAKRAEFGCRQVRTTMMIPQHLLQNINSRSKKQVSFCLILK
jgi:hypothetical protein